MTGAGLGLFTPPNNAAIMAAAPKRQSGMAGGVLNMTRGTGTALGLALTAAAYELGGSPWQGFRIAVLFLAAMAAAATWLASRRGPRPGGPGTEREDPSPGAAEELPGYGKLVTGAGAGTGAVPVRPSDHWPGRAQRSWRRDGGRLLRPAGGTFALMRTPCPARLSPAPPGKQPPPGARAWAQHTTRH